jgi:pSer/pThr/pTyr-binding forkhead associated (FHA) protein
MTPTQLHIRFYVIVEGGGGTTYSFPAKGELTLKIGTGDGCDIKIVDARASAVHAKFTWMKLGAEWHLMVEDQRSADGVFVNSSRVDSAWVDQGDCVQIGNTTLSVRFEPDDGPPSDDDDPSSPAGAVRLLPKRRFA